MKALKVIVAFRVEASDWDGADGRNNHHYVAGHFEKESVAKKLADELGGGVGNTSSVERVEIPIFRTRAEYDKYQIDLKRRAALDKLTDEEKELLGVDD
jgi:hypothetical protein